MTAPGAGAAPVNALTEEQELQALLPSCATPWQLSLSLADARLFDAPTEIVRTVLDPARAPAVLLPWLALQHRVKHTWDPSASLDRKRQIIAAQFVILQHAGTPKGLADALAQLGVGADYDEWFEYDGEPYHIRLRVEVGGVAPWTEAVDAKVWATTVEYKRRSVAVGDFAMVRTMPQGGPVMAGAQFIAEDITFLVIAPDIGPPPAVPPIGAALFIAETLTFGRAA